MRDGGGVVHRGAGVLLAALCFTASPRALAYRPFDGTDADVEEVGGFEAELGTAYVREEGENSELALPATVLNLGLLRGLEAVVDFKPVVPLKAEAGTPPLRLVDTDVLVKWVFVRGSLQDEHGPSLALETGPLLPEIHGDPSFGFQASLIGSERWSAVMLHLNALGAYSRTGDLEAGGSVIVEGVPAASVRPVTELLVGSAGPAGMVYSALGGAIWTESEVLALDAAGRVGREAHRAVFELRIGFTWSLAAWTARP